MNLSSPASPTPSGFITEPPLSPGAAPVSATPPPPVAPSGPPSTLSIEAQVVRLGLLTPDQVATAMREEAETGRTFDEVVVGHGWVSADDLARVRAPDAPAADPPTPAAAPAPAAQAPPVAAVPAPQPVAAAPPPRPVAVVPDPEPEPAPAGAATSEVFVHLTNGERISVGVFDSEAAAEARVRELIRLLDAGGDWPQLEGRYIRPDTVVSIDIE